MKEVDPWSASGMVLPGIVVFLAIRHGSDVVVEQTLCQVDAEDYRPRIADLLVVY